MSSLSQGPFNHNRFAAIDEFYAREKMYFMEKAKEKKAKPDFLDVDGDGDKEESFKKGVKDKKEGGDKKDGKKDLPAFLKGKKDMKESSCSSGCDCDDCKKSKKKKMAENREMAYGGGKAGKGSGDGSKPAGIKGGKTYKMTGKDGKPLFKEGMAMDEAIVSYLMYHGYANNPVSAEIVLKHMSENWLNDVANEINESLDN